MKRFYDKSNVLGSSWIDEIFYDERENTLYARMDASGMVYGHLNVPVNIYNNLVESYSPGTYYNQTIKGAYATLVDANINLEKRPTLKWTVTVQGTWDIEVNADTLEEAKRLAEKDAPEGVTVKGARVSFE